MDHFFLNYHPQTKFGARYYFHKRVSFCSQEGGRAWLGVRMAGGMHGKVACMARGRVWQGVCMVGGYAWWVLYAVFKFMM